MVQFLIEKGTSLLDTDRLEIGYPMVDLLVSWIQSHIKMPQLPPGVGEMILQILNILLKRVAFPDWCEIEVEPDDAQREYMQYRELFKVMFKNIALVKPIR